MNSLHSGSQASQGTRSFPNIDLLYDYGQFLRRATQAIGHLPPAIADKHIGIVGAGLSGLIAAYELLRAGATRITLFEASKDHLGGRFLTQCFDERQPQFIAEMGAMRFPPSEVGLFHYLDRFGIGTTEAFPDPGVVDTEIHYRGETHHWPAGENPPPIFNTVHRGWNAFLKEGVRLDDGTFLAPPLLLTDLLEKQQYEEVQPEWQRYLDCFGDHSFYSAMVQIFTSKNPPGGKRWRKPEDFHLFGSLGIGSGGFQSVYRASFTEILRLVINAFEVNQRLVPNGISTLSERIADVEFHGIALRDRICRTRIESISKDADGQILLQGCNGETYGCDRVITTATTRALQVNMRLTQAEQFVSRDVARAINETHMVGSSKLFILTRDKFWLKHGLAQNIQTDTLVKGVYCLDYAPQDPDSWGVVLISYTWEDDSHKMVSLTDKVQRCKRLVDELAMSAPEFARHLVPLDGDYQRYVLEYDWLTDKQALGAFKLNFPGDDLYSQRLFYQFKTALDPQQDSGLYLAGCGSSFTGGWAEGAVQTALNGACAVIASLGGELLEGNPLVDLQSHFNYC
ncbi:FAD-dependent oxidoreductase [Pseudomonas sp. NPDC089530]|uniref:NAD(P)/FAD-dependent oxidoreductase n=1 Tax=Pseudomonas sp. NPDC089530 TaxID=3390651 RepID=UPI003D028D84